MIKSIQVKNFKTLADIDIKLKNLNLLTGLNGTGKSSFIQVLLLLRQSVRSTKGAVKLNDRYVNIGKGKDALYQYAQDENIQFGLEFDDVSFTWDMKSDSDSDYLSPIDSDSDIRDIFEKLKEQPLFSYEKFQYLNVEHIAPQLQYRTSVSYIRDSRIGIKGEYVMHFLNSYGRRRDIHFENLHHPNSKTKRLIQEVNAWLGEISPHIKLDTSEVRDEIMASYQYATEDDYTMQFKPPNVGFGISHALPVITALLSAEPNKLIILENPESHLHPRGQSRMGRLIALAAQNDIQIILETHSDHILNGIRVAVKKGEVKPEKVGLFFFERKLESRAHRSIIHTPVINKNGRLNKWPEGFFDEWDNMLDELID